MRVEKEQLKEALKKLSERERKIMFLRFGLGGGEEMTQKAKQVKRYEQADKPKEKKKKERKVDETKALILGKLHETLETFVKITNVKTETEISFVYNDEEYTLKLTKHRKGK